MTYMLLNVEERRTLHPETWDLPSLDARRGLAVGDCAKLVFLLDPMPASGCSGERMWVLVKSIEQTPSGPVFTAALDNDPAFIRDMKAGDAVTFLPHHVIDIDPQPARSM